MGVGLIVIGIIARFFCIYIFSSQRAELLELSVFLRKLTIANYSNIIAQFATVKRFSLSVNGRNSKQIGGNGYLRCYFEVNAQITQILNTKLRVAALKIYGTHKLYVLRNFANECLAKHSQWRGKN